MNNSTTGEHNHCFCLQDAIGRPMCCKCYAVLLTNGSVQSVDDNYWNNGKSARIPNIRQKEGK